MAWARGRQAADETPKAECLRRWPERGLRGITMWHNGSRVGVRVEDKNGEFIAGEKAAYEAWAEALITLERSTQ